MPQPHHSPTTPRARSRNLVEIGGVAVVDRDPDHRRRGDPGEMVLFVEGGHHWLCVCMAAPDEWSKVELRG